MRTSAANQRADNQLGHRNNGKQIETYGCKEKRDTQEGKDIEKQGARTANRTQWNREKQNIEKEKEQPEQANHSVQTEFI